MGIGNVSERRNAPPQVGVTSVILALESEERATRDGVSRRRLWLPLVRRTREPFKGLWALPGGPLKANRSLEESAYETLASTTDLHPTYLEQLYTFGDPSRSSGGIPMVSICYWALVEQAEFDVRDSEHNVRWFAQNDLPQLAFDHARIIDYALWRLRHRIDTPNVVRQLIGEPFTLGQLHSVVEAVRGEQLDLANFRRKMFASQMLEDTGDVLREGRRRPAALYRFNSEFESAALDPTLFTASADEVGGFGGGYGRGDHESDGGMSDELSALSALMPNTPHTR